MFVPRWLLAATLFLFLLLGSWSVAVAMGRNPLPFPDRNYAVFTTPSPEAHSAMVELMRRNGIAPRFRADSPGVDRAILWDGTIINRPHQDFPAHLRESAAAIGLVASDPVLAAQEAVAMLRERGFQATMIEGAEPGLPIVFVTTDALTGSVLVFRKPILKMGPRPPAWEDGR